MSAALDRELGEIGKWYKEHREEVSSLEKRHEFLDRAFQHMLWLMARAVEDIKVLEGRTYPGRDIDRKGSDLIWTPR